MPKTKLDLEGKDNASRAFQSATERLKELRAEIGRLKSADITVGDSRKLQALTAEANRLEKALGGVGDTMSRVSSGGGLEKLISIGTVAAVAKTAIEIGKAAVELGNLGAQALTTEKSFRAVIQSVGASPELLGQMSSAAGGTIEKLRLMQLANTALAGASSELGNAFAGAIPKLIEGARAANMLNPALGDTEFLFQSLVTGIKRGSPMLIDNTGITLKLGEANEKYAAGIGKAASQLTEEEQKLALLQATMDGVDRLVQQAGGNLDTMATSAQKLKTAWAELRTEMGKKLAPGLSEMQLTLTRDLQAIADLMAGQKYELPSGKTSLVEKLAAAPAQYQKDIALLKQLQDELAGVEEKIRIIQDTGKNTEMLPGLEAGTRTLKTQITELTSKTNAVASAMAGAAVIAADWALRLREDRDAAGGAADAVDRLGKSLGNLPSLDPDALLAVFRATEEQPEMLGSGDAIDAWVKFQQQRKKDDKKAAEDAADAFQKEMESASSKFASTVQSKLSTAIQNSLKLKDLTGGGGLEPGANGPFEAIYRAQSIAVHGTGGANEQKWAAMYGLTQESAKKIVSDFQKGIFSPEVQGLIDTGALVDMLNVEKVAQASQKAFVAKIAQLSGGGTSAVKALLGMTTGEGGKSPAGEAIKSSMSGIADAMGAEVSGKDFAGRMIGFGNTIWGQLESGIIDRAKTSGVLYNAVYAMVLNILGGSMR